MQAYYYPAILTLLMALTYFWMTLTVARTHARTGILAPTILLFGALGRIIYLATIA